MTEIVVHSPGSEDEVVVRDRVLTCVDATAVGIYPRDLGEHDQRVSLTPEDQPDWLGNVRRAKRGGSDLVQKGLKQMVVVAVDQQHIDGRVLQGARREEPPKSTPDDDDLGPSWRLQYRS